MIKLFLAEDEIVMRDGIKKQIDWKKEDIEFVGEASDGELAWPMILETKPDILLTDIKMPFMDGLELSELVKKELPETYIIILSGYDEFSYAQRAVSLGVTEYLLKPLPPGKLLECIRKVKQKIEESRSTAEQDWRDEIRREQSDYQKQMLLRALVLGDRPLPNLLEMAEELHMKAVRMDSMWRASEDFGWYLKECPGAMVYIGSGEDYPALHTDAYDFNDGILETAVDLFVRLAVGE